MSTGATGRGRLPATFRFGVATAGFQCEGGYNGPDEPRNNWFEWESSGRVEPSGAAIHFWDRYEEQLDLVAGLGCNSFRTSIEWARVEPAEGSIDQRALERYRAIVQACLDRGLKPLLTLHHFTHPWWLGQDFWLQPDSPERFCRWVCRAVDALGDLCSEWITVNEANILAVESWLVGSLPPGRIGALRSAAAALDHLLTAHVLAYEAIHERQPEALVTTNNFTLSVYELDRMSHDLLMAPLHGVDRRSLGAWLHERRAEHYRSEPQPPAARRPLEQVLRRVAARAFPLERALPRTTAAVYGRPCDRLLDVSSLDYYAPHAAGHFSLPGRHTAGGRTWALDLDLWDDAPHAASLAEHCRRAVEPGLEVWVAENGMCNRLRAGRSYPRLDGWTRDRYLCEHLNAVAVAVDGGAPVTGYWHWTLADNYEWGSYEPRFGLYGVDRDRGITLGRSDAMGIDAAGAYAELIATLRTATGGDRP